MTPEEHASKITERYADPLSMDAACDLCEDITDAIRDAVLAERERCAGIAENWGNAPPNPDGRRAALARAIREGK